MNADNRQQYRQISSADKQTGSSSYYLNSQEDINLSADNNRKFNSKRKTISQKSNFIAFVDQVVSHKETTTVGSTRLAASGKFKQANTTKTKVTINEIDELEDAMDLLFGEQQEQTNQHDRVKFKAQEQSLNPCHVKNKNSA